VARAAFLYDVHGNLPALEAVLANARAAGASQFVLGGDYALFGPYPAETVAALRELQDAAWIRGNVDRWCAHPDQAPDDELIGDAITACREALGAAVVSELDGLPERLVVGETLFCHASPVSDVRSFFPRPGEDEDELLAAVDSRRLVFGHTHLQFRRVRPDGVELVNPGSVGLPFDGDHRAAYALRFEDGSLELRRVAYDHEASALAMVERFGESPWTRRTVERLRRARLM
jgi:diadenosine tetraphosphatase ApaH/serine/threonine PP2A family protein phosphatase